jgi:hypothetical protein
MLHVRTMTSLSHPCTVGCMWLGLLVASLGDEQPLAPCTSAATAPWPPAVLNSLRPLYATDALEHLRALEHRIWSVAVANDATNGIRNQTNHRQPPVLSRLGTHPIHPRPRHREEAHHTTLRRIVSYRVSFTLAVAPDRGRPGGDEPPVPP